MKTRKAISNKNLSSKSPILLGAVLYLLLDRFNASGVVWGIVIALYGIMFIAWVIDLFNTENVDIFEDKGDLPKKKFSERIEEMKNEKKSKEEKIFNAK
jgi:hypothetical protein